MPGFLLDASALLALMGGEPGAERVAEAILQGETAIATANLAEVALKLVARGMQAQAAETVCRSMALKTIDLDAETAFAAAALWPATRELGLSLGDRICLATAARNRLTALTADQAWARVQGITVEVIR